MVKFITDTNLHVLAYVSNRYVYGIYICIYLLWLVNFRSNYKSNMIRKKYIYKFIKSVLF